MLETAIVLTVGFAAYPLGQHIEGKVRRALLAGMMKPASKTWRGEEGPVPVTSSRPRQFAGEHEGALDDRGG
jgi:hypothetical protein